MSNKGVGRPGPLYIEKIAVCFRVGCTGLNRFLNFGCRRKCSYKFVKTIKIHHLSGLGAPECFKTIGRTIFINIHIGEVGLQPIPHGILCCFEVVISGPFPRRGAFNQFPGDFSVVLELCYSGSLTSVEPALKRR